MVKMFRFGTVVVVVVIAMRHVQGQAPGSNVPDSPMWPIFSQLLSTQTGRTVQDINILGLSDPTINQLWTSYSATLSKMTQTPAPTLGTSSTPPPLPDLYQSSYSFSSNSNQGSSSSSSSSSSRTDASTANTAKASGSTQNRMSYNDILSLINQLSSGGSAARNTPTKTTTTAQDVMKAYAQLSAGSGSASSSTPVQGNMDYRALLQKYMAGAASAGNTGNSGSSTSSPSYQSLVDQYNSLMNQVGGPSSSSSSSSSSYEQLLQQYNQIMGKASGSSSTPNKGSSPSSMMEQYLALISKPGSATATATATTSDQLLQMYKLISGGKAPSTDSTTTTTPAPTAASPQETFEKQLATFFPQFKSLFPQSSTSNSSTSSSGSASASASTAPAAGNTAQMIFDTLLFAPSKPTAGETAAGTASVATPGGDAVASNSSSPGQPVNNSPLTYIQNMMNSRGSSGAILSNHVQNVFKTRASREMGCRFLPELLELDLLPTAPVNCMNRCPFPYVNSQQFGIYCVCCPPGVNEHTVGMMSLVRGNSYMETPLSVVS